jgi:hypothetical protein
MAALESIDRMESGPISYTYHHFESVMECTHFANNTKQRVAYFCCGGKGIAIEMAVKPMVRPVVKKGKGTCDICYLEDMELMKPCQVCVNTLCGSCLDKLPQKICPYCRSEI